MTNVTTSSKLLHSTADVCTQLFDDWFDPIETGIRQHVRSLIEAIIEAELDAVLSQCEFWMILSSSRCNVRVDRELGFASLIASRCM
jgi:hypothetical protein